MLSLETFSVEEVLLFFGLVAGIAVAAYALTWLTWRPERNIARSELGHWFRSLIRLFETGSWVGVSQRRSSLAFALVRRGGEGTRCWVVLACASGHWSSAQKRAVADAVVREEGALALHRRHSGVPLPPELSGVELFQVQLKVSDIWASDAADAAIRIVDVILDGLAVKESSRFGSSRFDSLRFDLEFIGAPSTDRSFEARRRQLAGELEEW